MLTKQEWEEQIKKYKEQITNLQWDIKGLRPNQIEEKRKLEKQLEDLMEEYKLLYLNIPSDQVLHFKPLFIWYNDMYKLGIQYLDGRMVLFDLQDMPSVGKQFIDNNPRLVKDGEDYYIVFRDSLDPLGLKYRYHKVVLEEKPTVIKETVKEEVGAMIAPISNNRFDKSIVAKLRTDQLVCEKGHIVSRFGGWKLCPVCKSKFISNNEEKRILKKITVLDKILKRGDKDGES